MAGALVLSNTHIKQAVSSKALHHHNGHAQKENGTRQMMCLRITQWQQAAPAMATPSSQGNLLSTGVKQGWYNWAYTTRLIQHHPTGPNLNSRGACGKQASAATSLLSEPLTDRRASHAHDASNGHALFHNTHYYAPQQVRISHNCLWQDSLEC
jgi:hypothetical protein